MCGRLAECGEVWDTLVDGGNYTLLAKSGTDGQSGRGSFCFKGKKVNDNKRFNTSLIHHSFAHAPFNSVVGRPKLPG